MIGIISSPEFREILRQALLNSRPEISALAEKLKKQYNKAWGGSEFIEKRLAKEYSCIIIDQMLDILQSNEIDEQQEERADQGESEG